MANGLPATMRRGVDQLADLDDDTYDSLKTVYEGAYEQIRDLVEASAAKSGLDLDSARSIALTVTSLRQAYPRLADLEEASERAVPDDASDGNLASRVKGLIGARSVTLLARATRLQLDNDHNYSGSFAATSTRPLFPNAAEDAWLDGNEESQDFYGSVVVTQLRLDYFDDSRLRSFFVAMDLDDLHSLRGVIDRAIKKHASVTDDLGKQHRLAMNPLGGE